MTFPRDSHVTAPAEIRRTMSAAKRILARLQDGPASAQELAAITLKYTQRVSDLRKAGSDVRCREDAVSGASTYFLVKPFARCESSRTADAVATSVQTGQGSAIAPAHDLNEWGLR